MPHQAKLKPRKREKISVEIPVDTLKLVQDLASRLGVPAGVLIGTAVKSATTMVPVLRRRGRDEMVEKKLTSFNVSPETKEMWGLLRKRAREENVFLWHYVDSALRQYKLGRFRPAMKRAKKN